MSCVRNSAIVLVLISGIAGALEFDPETAFEPLLLRDGFCLSGVDGTLIGSDSNDVWHFELSEDVNDYRAVAKAGTRLELLPSSTLERMIADAKTRSAPDYRLWNAEVTRYEGKNFLFPRYFLPLRKRVDRAQETEGKTRKPEDGPQSPDLGPRTSDPNTFEVAIDEPNDILAVPAEIIERLKARQARPMTTSLRDIVDSNGVPAGAPFSEDRFYAGGVDSVFVDRTGLLVKRADGEFVYEADALGRNVQQLSLTLLPCEVLELTARKQADELEPLRFKVAGILTKYKDETYLLLQKATRVYSHGNFGR
jgi:hypothetical protein